MRDTESVVTTKKPRSRLQIERATLSKISRVVRCRESFAQAIEAYLAHRPELRLSRRENPVSRSEVRVGTLVFSVFGGFPCNF